MPAPPLPHGQMSGQARALFPLLIKNTRTPSQFHNSKVFASPWTSTALPKARLQLTACWPSPGTVHGSSACTPLPQHLCYRCRRSAREQQQRSTNQRVRMSTHAYFILDAGRRRPSSENLPLLVRLQTASSSSFSITQNAGQFHRLKNTQLPNASDSRNNTKTAAAVVD